MMMQRLVRDRSIRIAIVACFALVVSAADASGQQYAVAQGDGGAPRFLFAVSRGETPVPVDAGSIPSLGRRIDLNLSDVTIDDALRAIASASRLQLVYSAQVVPVTKRVSVKASGITVAAALTEVLFKANVDVLLSGGRIVMVRGPKPLQVGTVTGRVIDASTQQGVAGVRVSLEGTRWGTTTGSTGSYRLAGVAAGAYTLVTRRLGYKAAERAVVVEDDRETTLDLTLEPVPSALNEVVVTGTAGSARRREVGNSIAQIDLSERTQPTADLEQLLQGQVAGVSVQESGGQVGGGRQIRLRGAVSVAMSNQPLIYVDGVRMRSDMLPQNMLAQDASASGLTTTSGSGSGTVSSPLNNIDPHDIARIEIIKGAAATTLYGTEAAAGVIQIFTKRGQAGAAAWTFATEQGISEMRQAFGTDDKPFLGLDPWMKRGWAQNYNLSVSGGTEAIRYYLSGGYTDNDGNFDDDWQTGVNVRGNFNFRPTEKLSMAWNTAISRQNIQNVAMGNNAEGLTLNVYRSPNNYIGSAKKEDIDRLFEQEWLTNTDQLISGLTVTHQTSDKITNRLTVGFDRLASELIGTFPYGFITDEGGLRTNRRWLSETLTFDYVGTLETRPRDDLSARLSVGMQGITSDISSVWGQSEDFPGPGEPTLTTGANTRAWEDRQRVITAGVFGETLLGLKDRYFLTLGARVDGNTAFGQNLGVQVYPKASVSYVLSEEPFFPENLGTLKLRGAYGHAGRAPGAFDATRTWRAAGWAGEPAFLPNAAGNADLGAERTAELEFGFDGNFLGDRVEVSMSYYNATTSDALLPVTQIPSLGFGGTQLMNVGTIRNTGIEVTTNTLIIDRPQFAWSLGLNYSRNKNKVTDLGGAAAYLLGETGWVVEDQPAPVIIGSKLTNPDAFEAPVFERSYQFGPNVPVNIVQLSSTFTLPLDIQLSGQVEYMGGHYIFDRASRNMAQRGVWPPCQGAGGGYEKIAAGQIDELTAYDRATCVPTATPRDFMNFPADFAKLRHLTIGIPVPAKLLVGATGGQFSVSLRNVRIWKDPLLKIFDPEMAGAGGASSAVRAIVENVPSPMSVIFALRLRM